MQKSLRLWDETDVDDEDNRCYCTFGDDVLVVLDEGSVDLVVFNVSSTLLKTPECGRVGLSEE